MNLSKVSWFAVGCYYLMVGHKNEHARRYLRYDSVDLVDFHYSSKFRVSKIFFLSFIEIKSFVKKKIYIYTIVLNFLYIKEFKKTNHGFHKKTY